MGESGHFRTKERRQGSACPFDNTRRGDETAGGSNARKATDIYITGEIDKAEGKVAA